MSSENSAVHTDQPNSLAGFSPWLVVLLGALLGYALVSTLKGLISDEGFHAGQIWFFYIQSGEMSNALTVPPTYHYILAFIARQIGYYSDDLTRFISLCFSLLALPAYYRLVQHYYPNQSVTRTLQFFFFPLIYPFFFLIYTDIWTLAAIAAMLLFTLRRMYLLAATLGLIATMLRQTAIVWVGLAYLLMCFEFYESRTEKFPWKTFLKNALVQGLPFLVVFGLFLAFVIINEGVAIGDKGSHGVSINLTNLYFFLLCTWIFFLPLAIESLPRIVALFRKPWVLAALIGGLLFYLGTYNNAHPYNQPNLDNFLRNQLLQGMTESLLIRVLFYIPIAWMVLTLAVIRLPEKRLYWLYAVIPLSIVVHPLIEQRYYYPAMMLLLAWRPAYRPQVETLTLATYLLLSAYLLYGIVMIKFFI